MVNKMVIFGTVLAIFAILIGIVGTIQDTGATAYQKAEGVDYLVNCHQTQPNNVTWRLHQQKINYSKEVD